MRAFCAAWSATIPTSSSVMRVWLFGHAGLAARRAEEKLAKQREHLAVA